MTPAGLLEEKIKQAVRLGMGDAALAADYARECRRVNSRLEQLREVLDNGLEIQALLMAETPPSILEEASALQGVAADWKLVCEAHGLEAPPELLFQAAQRLNLLYSKGISPSHEIYRDFREAVMARDDLRAMEISRAIEKLNPGDANAVNERGRLEAKVFRSREEQLEKALLQNNQHGVLDALEALEALGLPNLEGESSARLQAQQVRQDVASHAAQQDLDERLGVALQDAFDQNDWRVAREILARIDGACAEHHLALAPAITDLVARARNLVQKESEAMQKTADFQRALRGLLTQIDKAESQLNGSTSGGLKDLRELLAGLKKAWQRVETFSMVVAPEIVQKVSKQASALEDRVHGLQRRNLIIASSVIIVAIVVLSASGWWILGNHSASRSAVEIKAAIAARLPKAAAKLSKDAQERGLTQFSPSLVSTITEAETYAEAEEARLQEAVRGLERFEESAKADFAGKDANSLGQNWASYRESLKAIADETITPHIPRIQALDKSIKSHIESKLGELYTNLQERFNQFEENFLALVRSSTSLDQLQDFLNRAQSEVRDWSRTLQASTTSTPPPPEMQTRAEAYERQLAKQSEDLNLAKQSRDAMRKAATIDDFVAARKSFVTSLPDFSIQEINLARKAQAIQVTQDKFLAELMLPWNPSAWLLYIQGGDAAKWLPDTMTEGELSIYGQLYNSVGKQKIYENLLRVNGPTPEERTIYSLNGPLKETIQDFSYAGTVCDTLNASRKIEFIDKKYQKGDSNIDANFDSIRSLGECDFSIMSNNMNLEKFINSDGKPLVSPWEVIDRATSSRKVNPVYLVYVVQNIDAMTMGRPLAWGAHFTPSFASLRNQVNQAVQGSKVTPGDWMTSEHLKDRLRNFQISATRFRTERLFMQNLAESVKSRGLQFAGYIDADGQPIVNSSVVSRELWGLSGEMSKAKPTLLCVQDDSGKWKVEEKVLPFTPVFAYGGDRRAAFDHAVKMAAINNWSGIEIPPFVQDFIPDVK